MCVCEDVISSRAVAFLVPDLLPPDRGVPVGFGGVVRCGLTSLTVN